MKKWVKIIIICLNIVYLAFTVADAASHDWHLNAKEMYVWSLLCFCFLCQDGIVLYKVKGDRRKKLITLISAASLLAIFIFDLICHFKATEVSVIIACLPAIIYVTTVSVIGLKMPDTVDQ